MQGCRLGLNLRWGWGEFVSVCTLNVTHLRDDHRRSHHCRHCRLSSVHWRRNCFADHTTTQTSGNNSIDTSLIRDIHCGPEVSFETCVAMKFLHDDDDDDDEVYTHTNNITAMTDNGQTQQEQIARYRLFQSLITIIIIMFIISLSHIYAVHVWVANLVFILLGRRRHCVR